MEADRPPDRGGLRVAVTGNEQNRAVRDCKRERTCCGFLRVDEAGLAVENPVMEV